MKRLIAIAALTLAACGSDHDLDEPTTVEQALTLPACTAANEGAEQVVNIRRNTGLEVTTYQCQSGTWTPIRRCANGSCVDY